MQNKSSKILMIKPVMFGFNEQTAISNAFQKRAADLNAQEIQRKALTEFENFVSLLRSKRIEIIVFEDTLEPNTPDSIFPNNWISFHTNDQIVLYPMFAENRRDERRKDVINYFVKKSESIIDLTAFEEQDLFLEGTGSIVFDYENKIAYASRSVRTNKELFEKLCSKLNLESIFFNAVDENGIEIYHTNVLMCVGTNFAVVCKECIKDNNELNNIIQTLEKTNHEIIEISYKQMNSFAGNMYQLFNVEGKSFIVMSTQAHSSLTVEQKNKLKQFGELLFTPLDTIERYGGGSARCMLADIKF